MKECKVLSQTDFYVLVDYDGEVIQFPPISEKVDSLFVEKDANGAPRICSKDEKISVVEEIIEKPKRRSRKVKEVE